MFLGIIIIFITIDVTNKDDGIISWDMIWDKMGTHMIQLYNVCLGCHSQRKLQK